MSGIGLHNGMPPEVFVDRLIQAPITEAAFWARMARRRLEWIGSGWIEHSHANNNAQRLAYLRNSLGYSTAENKPILARGV